MQHTPATSADTGSPGSWAYLHLLVVYLVWGSTYLAVKICLSGPEAATPWQLQAARLGCATLLLAAYAWFMYGLPKRPERAAIITGTTSGILLWVLGNGLATWVAQDTTSSFIVMCMGLIPLWMVTIESLMTRKWPTRRAMLGLVAGLVGLVVMVAPTLQSAPDMAIIRPGQELPVLASVLAGGAFWAWGSSLQRRQPDGLPAAWIATLQMGAATVLLLAIAAFEQGPLPSMPAPRQWLAFGFLVICGSILAMISFQKVIRHFPPSVASTFAYVNPLVGMLLGAWLLHEPVHGLSIVGFAIILGSLWLVLRHH